MFDFRSGSKHRLQLWLQELRLPSVHLPFPLPEKYDITPLCNLQPTDYGGKPAGCWDGMCLTFLYFIDFCLDCHRKITFPRRLLTAACPNLLAIIVNNLRLSFHVTTFSAA